MADRNTRRGRWIGILIAAIAVIFAFAGAIATFYTDVLWYRDLGQEPVFWTGFWGRLGTGLVFGLVAFAFVYANLLIARRLKPPLTPVNLVEGMPAQVDDALQRVRGALEPYVGWVLLGVALFVGWGAGVSMAGEWLLFRTALAAAPFGVADPQFGRDVSFFVFQLPALRSTLDWLFGILATGLVVTALVHLYDGGIRPADRLRGFDPHVKAHLSVLAGLLVAAKALDYWLSIFELDFSPRGQVLGASFTDVNAQIPAYTILIVIAIACGVALMVNIRFRGWRLPAVALGVWIGAALLVGGVYPSLVQQFQVAPNELVAESPYIKRNIEFTRRAFALDTVDERQFAARTDLTAQDVAEATATIRNARLWDPNIVAQSYKQLQEIRLYYDFKDVDIDRYVIDGTLEEVLVSVREMNVEQLVEQARTWVNQHLVYTHGYGAVMSPVNEASSDGLPMFFIKDLPPTSTVDVGIRRPGIYFGEESNEYAIVDTAQKEFDYPVGGANATTSYEGKSGVDIGSPLNRLAFALRFGSPEILFTSTLRPTSRVLFRRDISERIHALAPWMMLDGDPYAVITPEGGIVWVQDAYTYSSYYPYSERNAEGINYIRNSVKVVIDAYEGTTTLYAFDEKDPVLATFRTVFPGLLTDGAEMPAYLAGHLRYPEDLFKVQSEVYATYHMLDPAVFYNKEDQWALPGAAAGTPMEPFYVLMTLPGETQESFILMRPFTPRNKDNMVGWMAAHSDPGRYGQRLVYALPKQRLILGPQQIRARINQEPDISKELTLLNQQGSNVQFGNLLVLPIKDSLVYIQPLYLQAQQSAMPELKRVIVAYADRVAMAPAFDEALAAVFGTAAEGGVTGGGATGKPSGGGATGGGATAADAQLAASLYKQALDAQRNGDWAAYGSFIDQLGVVLDRMASTSDSTATP